MQATGFVLGNTTALRISYIWQYTGNSKRFRTLEALEILALVESKPWGSPRLTIRPGPYFKIVIGWKYAPWSIWAV